MSTTLSKKLVGAALTITTFTWMGGAFLLPVANAQSTADLQAQIAALLAQIQALQSQLSSAPGGSAVQCTFSRDLTVGSTGDDVKCLQKYLNGAGFQVASTGAGSPGSESSYFGSLTKAAAMKWQNANSAQVLAPLGLSAGTGYWGAASRAYYNQVAATPGTPGTPSTPGTPGTPTVPSGPFTISLASDNPAGAAVPKGASGVTVLKFVVSGSGTLDSLVFKRAGIGATADFQSSGIYLYEGASRLTSGKTLNSTTHEISLVGLALAVSGSRTFSLVADFASGATTGNRSNFELVSAVGTPAVAGSLRGNTFEMAGQAVGGLDPTSGAAPASPKIGQMAAKLGEFRLTASSTEDVLVHRLSLTEGGSITNANLTNFVLKQAGNTVATAAAIGAKDLVTFNLATPFKVEKGQQKTFEIYGDIAGNTRAADTIVFYFDSKSDIYALGATYGYPVLPTIDALDATTDGDTLTIQGGDVTITFNGPISGDLALRGQDVTILDFSIASQNNIEIKNLRLRATTTALTTNDGFNDFKVWDVDTSAVITSAVDLTTSTAQTFTDTININAGQRRHFKVTVDVDADDDAGDTILVGLLAFQLGDIKNLDNNTNVALASIVPNAAVVGNTHSVVAPGLDIQLSATPSSQTYVQGSTDKPLVGFSFRATADNIRIDQIVVSSTASTGTLGAGEVQNLALYDGATRISDFKSLDTSTFNATFSNLNYVIAKGVTKVITLRGSIATDASNNDVYYFLLNATTEVTAYDSEGNSVTNTGIAANNGGTVKVTIASVGDVTIVKAPDDFDSEAGIVIAGTEVVLGKYRVTSASEDMTINNIHILVSSSTSATATSTVPLADEVPTIKLYDGTTLIGSTNGYSVLASGASSGIAIVNGLGWVVPKDTTKTLVVKGVLNTIAAGADTGTQTYTHVQATGFEAQGQTSKDNAVTAASGNLKVLYKTKPTITKSATQPTNKLGNGLKEVIRFKVKADGPEAISFKKFQLYVSMTGATMSLASSTSAMDITIKEVGGSNLTIASAFSGEGSASTTNATIPGGQSGYVTFILSSEQSIAAGTEKEYVASLTFANVSVTVGAASADVKFNRSESSLVAASTYNGVETATLDGEPSFIWSDYSATGHSETTLDWINGFYVKSTPTDGTVITNN